MKAIRLFRTLLVVNSLREYRITQIQSRSSTSVGIRRCETFTIEQMQQEHRSPTDVANEVRKSGVSTGFRISGDKWSTLLKELSSGSTSELALELAQNPFILATAEDYLGMPPLLASIQVFDDEPDLDPPYWHFDLADLRSISVFVYVTRNDDKTGGYHQCVPGSHRGQSLSSLAKKLFAEPAPAPDTIQKMLGDEGTMFFEDTEVYHSKAPHQKRRLALQILFTMTRPSAE